VKLASHWIRIGRWRVHARIALDQVPRGTLPVVLVHGIGVSSSYLIPTAEQLARWYPVLVPDLPGFGESDKPEESLSLHDLADILWAFVRQMDFERTAVIGNSFGCQIITDLIVRHAEVVERAVFLAPTIDPAARTWQQQIGRLFLDAVREPVSLFPLVVHDYSRCGFRRLRATFEEALGDVVESKLPNVAAPTLVVHGSRDPIVPRRWAREAADLLPCGWLSQIPGAAHAANYSHPREVASIVREFLETPWAATPHRSTSAA